MWAWDRFRVAALASQPAAFRNSAVEKSPELENDFTMVQYPVFNQLRIKFGAAGVKSDAEVVQFWTEFQQAVVRNDKYKVASMANYPLQLNFSFDSIGIDHRGREIKNRGTLIKAYDKIFDGALKQLIAQTPPDTLHANYLGIVTPHGKIWLEDLCQLERADCSYGIKLLAINNDRIYMRRRKIR